MKIVFKLSTEGRDEIHERVYSTTYYKNAIYKPTHIGVGSSNV